MRRTPAHCSTSPDRFCDRGSGQIGAPGRETRWERRHPERKGGPGSQGLGNLGPPFRPHRSSGRGGLVSGSPTGPPVRTPYRASPDRGTYPHWAPRWGCAERGASADYPHNGRLQPFPPRALRPHGKGPVWGGPGQVTLSRGNDHRWAGKVPAFGPQPPRPRHPYATTAGEIGRPSY